MDTEPGKTYNADAATKVMRQFLLRSSSLNEEDVMPRTGSDAADGDLEVDGDDSQSQADEAVVMEVAASLGKIGDELQRKYEKQEKGLPSVNNFVTKFVKEQSYKCFSNGVKELTDLCQNTDILGSDEKNVAFVMFLVQKVAEASKGAGGKLPEIRKGIIIGEMYIRQTYGELIGSWSS